ncbi:MAG TPA: hypothetical protein VEA69_21715 [Tepidisphaeraceae bacterium]|nr:hypothetical protein [Tepidisphaeraceae bacterium]
MSHGRDDVAAESIDPGAPATDIAGAPEVASTDAARPVGPAMAVELRPDPAQSTKVAGAFASATAQPARTRGIADIKGTPAIRATGAGHAFEKSSVIKLAATRTAEAAAVRSAPAAGPTPASPFDDVEPEGDEEYVEEDVNNAADPWGAQDLRDVKPKGAPVAIPRKESVEANPGSNLPGRSAERVARTEVEPDDAPSDETESSDESEEYDDAEAVPASRRRGGGVLTIPLICVGIAIIACVTLIPLADDNRRVAWEREKLRTDLAHLKEQVRVNDEFLQRVADDPTLAERLAQRQMRYLREGTRVLPLRGMGKVEMSPFHLVSVPPPAPQPEYQPLGGALATIVRTPRGQLYSTGAALLLIAAGLVLGYVPIRAKGDEE